MADVSTVIWTEKYRPRTFDEIHGQDGIVAKVRAFVEQRNLPHLLLTGPAGTGKTSMALVIARALFGEGWRENFLELNASDERGIDVVRVKVKDFARTRAIGDVPFKIIYLDECLGPDAIVTLKSPDDGVCNARIADVVENDVFSRHEVLSVDDDGRRVFVPLRARLKLPHEKEKGFFRLTIHDRTLDATGNHLLLTKDGWKEAGTLAIGDMVLCPLAQVAPGALPSSPVDYLLVGLPREIRKKERYIAASPEKLVVSALGECAEGLTWHEVKEHTGLSSSKVSRILSERRNPDYLALPWLGIVHTDRDRFMLAEGKASALERLYKAKREQNMSNNAYIQETLSHMGLYPLAPDKAVVAARITGHLFGDGCLSLKTRQLFFSGKEEDMQEIIRDINALGFHALGNVRRTTWRNGECWSFAESKIALISLFYSLGVPVGRKTDTPYGVPAWILDGSQGVKQAFLAAFFGSEGSKPSFQERTVKPIVVAQAKEETLVGDLGRFLHQLRGMLREFGIASTVRISTTTKNVRKDGSRTMEGKLSVNNARRNILRFISTIGYGYCSYKQKEAVQVAHYLRWKESLGKGVYAFRPVAYFDRWLKEHVCGDSAFHYVTGLKRLDDPVNVYCLSTENQKFIANDVVVHNCDALTKEAQQALRRTMENYTQTCRFILSANFSSKIIDPIQSRCAIFRFKPLPDADIRAIISMIATREDLMIDADAYPALVEVAGGDCRRLANIVQSASVLGENVTAETVYTLSSHAKPTDIVRILELAIAGRFHESRSGLLDVMLKYGMSGLDVIKQIQPAVWQLKVPDRLKVQLIDKCGEIEFRMVEGADEYVQLEALLAYFTLAKQ